MQYPFFSIIIPTYNRPQALSQCLASLAQLDYPGDRVEIIIVDDGSPTPLEATVKPWRDRLNLTLFRQNNSGPAAARNAGARQARGEYLAFTDDDCCPNPDWLTAFAERLKTAPHHLIGGRTINALSDNPYAATSQGIVDVVYTYYHNSSKPLRFFASNNFAVPKTAFLRLGGFNPRFRTSEDREFCDRWLRAGYNLIYAPEAAIRHAHHLTLKSFWQQHFGYGRGAWCFHQQRSERGQGHLKIEPRFYASLLRYPFTPAVAVQPHSYLALLSIAQLANLAGFLAAKNEQGKQNKTFTPPLNG
jgi:GT2 family glycosyltransferase